MTSSYPRPKTNFAFVAVGLVCIVAGLYLSLKGIDAINTGETVHLFGTRPRPISGIEAILGGCIAVALGLYGVWMGLKGEQ